MLNNPPVKQPQFLFLGLDNSGKTRLLYYLKLKEKITTIPTIGYNVEEITTDKGDFSFWDVGGQPEIQGNWKEYYKNMNGFIYVIDGANKDRLKESKEAFEKVIKDEEVKDHPILILVTKRDIKTSMSVEEITEQFELKSLTSLNWIIQPCTDEGLKDGIDWLIDNKK